MATPYRLLVVEDDPAVARGLVYGLRYEGFEARASGVRALLPHVDRFLPVHNLASLADLGSALRATPVAPHTLLH